MGLFKIHLQPIFSQKALQIPCIHKNGGNAYLHSYSPKNGVVFFIAGCAENENGTEGPLRSSVPLFDRAICSDSGRW